MPNSYTMLISSRQLDEITPYCLTLDCRAQLGDADWGLQQFRIGHIPGAIRSDLEQDLSEPSEPSDQRGRHPLPQRQVWAQTLGRWGLKPNQQVVAYDDAGGAYAARAWWMLRWAGHANVAVLDGGYTDWTQIYPDARDYGDGRDITPTTFDLSTPLEGVTTTETIANALATAHPLPLVDARTENRWAGKEEPIDPVAGHIPSAACLPFQDNLTANGQFKSAAQLAARYIKVSATASKENPIVCYCGSGVTATHNILAMRIAGVQNVTLYPNSWSGWISDPARPIETTP